MADKKYEPHMMYDAKKAETHKEHLKLKNQGYTHSPNKMRTSPLKGLISSPLKCWKGYERVPGTKEFSKGSCRKK
jgi:hypothetical protein